MMEPFAFENSKKPATPWVIAAILFAALVAWQLDYFPRLRPASSGTLAETSSSLHAVTPLDASWDEIVDRSADLQPTRNDAADPLQSALAMQSEPLDTTVVPENTRNSLRQDSMVRPASFELAEPTDLSAQSSSDADSDSQMGVIPAELAERLRAIDMLFRDGNIAEAHARLSWIYWKQPSYRRLIKSRLEHTAAEIFAGSDYQLEDPHIVEFGETLNSIAARHNVPWTYLARLNNIAPRDLQAGQTLKVISGPFSALVDLDEFSLTVHAQGWFIHRYQVGIGKEERTPRGEFKVKEKLENPTWYNPDGGVVDADDPSNPLGEFWLGLGDHIGIHGTIDADSIGTARSRGCIHLADGDIEEVFNLLSIGSTVVIRD